MEPALEWDVVVLGGINSDYLVHDRELPSPGATAEGHVFLTGPGGKGGNAAVAAARLGARTAIIGRVGRDERGRMLLSGLVEAGVHASRVGVDEDTPTGAAVIQVDESGNKRIFAALGANLRLRVEDVNHARELIARARVLLAQLEVPIECVAAAVRLARAAGTRVVLDPAPPRPVPAELIAMLDVIRGTAAEIEALSGCRVSDRRSAATAARRLLARGAGAVIVAVAEGNLLICGDDDEVWLPELPARKVDTTGAGDAFSAAVAVAMAEGQTFARAGQFASGAAALAASTLGAQPGLPSRSQLDAFLAEMAATESR